MLMFHNLAKTTDRVVHARRNYSVISAALRLFFIEMNDMSERTVDISDSLHLFIYLFS